MYIHKYTYTQLVCIYFYEYIHIKSTYYTHKYDIHMYDIKETLTIQQLLQTTYLQVLLHILCLNTLITI